MSTRRPKSVLDQENRYTAELSTGQLVIGVCILLMFGLGCFLLGVLIGKFDPTLRPQTAQNDVNSRADEPTQEIKVSELPSNPSPPPPVVTTSEPTLPPEMRVPPNMLKEEPAPAATPEKQPEAAAEPSGSVTTTPPPAA